MSTVYRDPTQHEYTAPPVYQATGYTMPISYNESEQETGVLRETATWIPSPPAEVQAGAQVLNKPVVIPRIDVSSGLAAPIPFMRAYSLDLQAYDVTVKDFVGFIDDLSIAQAPPAPLQALNTAGHVLGFVPEPVTMITGTSLNIAAGVGTAATSAIRTHSLMEKMNREYFAPRGLKASICKDEGLASKLGFDLSIALAALDLNSDQMRAGQRQLQAIEQFIAPLTFDVPPPTPQRNAIDQMAAKMLQREEKKRKEKDFKEQTKRIEVKKTKQPHVDARDSSTRQSDYGFDSSTSSSSDPNFQPNKSTERLRKKLEEEQRKKEKREAKADKKQAKKDEKEQHKLEKKSAKTDEKIKKMEYIVVELLDTA